MISRPRTDDEWSEPAIEGRVRAHLEESAALMQRCLDASSGAIPAVALTADTSVLTAIANDFGYGQVFARQAEALVRAGDAVIAISTSGASENTSEGARAARRAGARIIALTGQDGGALAALADVAVRVPSTQTALIQEAHIAIGHAICAIVEEAWGSAGPAAGPEEAADNP